MNESSMEIPQSILDEACKLSRQCSSTELLVFENGNWIHIGNPTARMLVNTYHLPSILIINGEIEAQHG